MERKGEVECRAAPKALRAVRVGRFDALEIRNVSSSDARAALRCFFVGWNCVGGLVRLRDMSALRFAFAMLLGVFVGLCDASRIGCDLFFGCCCM